MNRFFILALSLLAACGGPVEKSEPTVIVDDDDDSNIMAVNNDTPVTSSNNTEPLSCCDGRQCGAAPGCEESCGSCDGDAFCDEAGTCIEAAPDAPQILDLSTNTNTITENGSITFSVVVTDPDGIDDLIGGTLKSPAGSSYGSFQTAAAEGAYSLTVTWNEMNTVQPILFEGMAERVFIAEFYDQAGNRVQRESNILLTCGGPGGAACEPGRCISTDANLLHCGACGNEVPDDISCSDGSFSCQSGDYCPQQEVCSSSYEPFACGSCGNDCTRLATTLGVTLDAESSNNLECRQSACEITFETTSLASCDEQCGPFQCVGAFAQYDGTSGFTANCGEEWEPEREFRSHIFTECTCRD